MLTFNVYHRTFFIRSAEYGTGFTVDHAGRQYLVTAKHLLSTDVDKSGIKIFYKGRFQRLRVETVGLGHGEIDIAVLAPSQRMSPAYPLEAVKGGFTLGQEVYLAGYPYKLFADGGDLMEGRPLPFIKRGTLSAFDHQGEARRIYLDAINNAGFSGGPVVFHTGIPNELKVMGVISKFRIEEEAVVDAEGIDTGMRVSYNTGIAIAYGMEHFLEIVEKNPAGYPLDLRVT
jgi:hypothetical protein